MKTAERSFSVRGAFSILWTTLFLVQVADVQTLCAAVVTFQDSHFNASDWTSTKYVDATVGQGAFFAANTIPSGGNPDSYRQVLLTFREGGAMRVSHLRDGGANAFKWNPSTQGAFMSIDYSFDLVMTNYFDPAPTPAPGQTAAVGYTLLLLQGGHYYTSSVEIASTLHNKQWVSISQTNRPASSFLRVNLANGTQIPGLHPDFSSTGSEIIFGYDSLNAHGSTGIFKATESGIDNYSVSLQDVHPVPEPASATLAVLLSGLTGLAAVRRKRGQPKTDPIR
jgi:hypothetical protein